jgi:chromosome segregation ATPase
MADIDPTTKETTETVTQIYPTTNTGSVDDQLKALKQQLDALENDLSIQSQLRDALKKDFTALEKNANEVKQAPDAYEQARPALDQEKEALSQYHNTKYQMVTSALGEKKRRVDEEIGKVDKAINDKRNDAAAKENAAKEAGKQYEDAKKALDAAQGKSDNLKNLQKDLRANLQKMKDWRKAIEEFDDRNDSKSMYVYLIELKKVLDNTTIKTKDEYKADLENAWKELNAAKDVVRDKQSAWDNARNALTQAQAELKTLEDNRIKDILEKIKPL